MNTTSVEVRAWDVGSDPVVTAAFRRASRVLAEYAKGEAAIEDVTAAEDAVARALADYLPAEERDTEGEEE